MTQPPEVKFSPVTPAAVRAAQEAAGQRRHALQPVQADPDRFLMQAKQLVVDNYNEAPSLEEHPELTIDDVYIIWYTKLLGSWKALLSSHVVKGLTWQVTYNRLRYEAYIEVYKKINNIVVPMDMERI